MGKCGVVKQAVSNFSIETNFRHRSAYFVVVDYKTTHHK